MTTNAIGRRIRTGLAFAHLVAVPAAILASSVALAKPECERPMRFRAGIEGFRGPSYSVELKAGDIRYSAREPGSETTISTIRATPSQWCEFRRSLDDLGMWEWREAYSNPKVLDGTQWDLDIAYADHSLRTQGFNDYPKSFTAYLSAVEKLVGGKPFR